MSSQYSIDTNDHEYVLTECTSSNFIKWLVESSNHWRNIGFRPEIFLPNAETSTYVYENYANILIGERLSDHVLKQLWDNWIINHKNPCSFNRSIIEEGIYNGYKLRLLHGDEFKEPLEIRYLQTNNKYNSLPSTSIVAKDYFYLFEHTLDNKDTYGEYLGELDLVKSRSGNITKFVKISNMPNLT